MLSTLVAFISGIYIAGSLGAGKGQMLAAAAIVLGWGFLTSIFALLLAILLASKIAPKLLVKVNWMLLFLLLSFVAIMQYRYMQRQKVKSSLNFEKPAMIHRTSIAVDEDQRATSVMGLGFFQPDFFGHARLNFYGQVNLEKSLDEHFPQDSIVFRRSEQGLQVKYVPPWVLPEHMKLDYGIMFFKVLGYGHDFLQIETNGNSGRYNYVSKTAGRFIPWSEFLISSHALELKDKFKQKIYQKPSVNTATLDMDYSFLKPLFVESEWVKVKLVDENFREVAVGWTAWNDGQNLLIEYSLLN
ncbi:MAG: hypothetical protein AAF616_06730 [Bacteroidota bacterium]